MSVPFRQRYFPMTNGKRENAGLTDGQEGQKIDRYRRRLKMTVAESAKAIEEHLRQLRREFHRHPETSGNEKETAARVVMGAFGYRADLRSSEGVGRKRCNWPSFPELCPVPPQLSGGYGCPADRGGDRTSLLLGKQGGHACLRP